MVLLSTNYFRDDTSVLINPWAANMRVGTWEYPRKIELTDFGPIELEPSMLSNEN